MNRHVLIPCLLLAAAPLAFTQATPTPTPGDKPGAWLGNGPNPNAREKKDKSRLRDIKGVVRDENDNPLEGAIVKLKNINKGTIVTWRTGKDGTYVFHECSMDADYELTATHDALGLSTTRKVSQYDTRKPATMNLQLQRKS